MSVAGEAAAALATHLAADRRQALAAGEWLADRETGTVLFADIGGFTPLSESMEDALGPQRGAEEMAGCIHGLFDALVAAVERRHGSIVAFAGDALTCWFGPGRALSAVACALEMQHAVATTGSVSVPGVGVVSLTLKVALAGGEGRRFVIGDPEAQVHDVLAGPAVDAAGAGEKRCARGEVVLDLATAETLGGAIETGERRNGYVVVAGLRAGVDPDPWPSPGTAALADEQLRPWMPPAVYERLRGGQARFLAEFRPVVSVFVSFGGIDYTSPDAGNELDAFVRRAQATVADNGGTVLDISMGDKGSYLLAVFGAPVATGSEARRAVNAAVQLRAFRDDLQIGIATGRVFASLYAGRLRSAYSVLGDVVNIAARLMSAARPGQVLMTGRVGEELERRFAVTALEAITVKGREAPVAICELADAGARADADADRGLSEPRYPLPLVGRRRELAAIDAALADAGQGRGGVLAFRAEAGMGKSRLVSATIRRAERAGFAVVAGECQPHGTGTAYLPWRPVWNALLGLPPRTAENDEARRLALAETLAGAAPQAAPLAPLLSAVLDLPIEDNDATRGMPAPARKQLLEQVLTGALRARAAHGPVCIVLEDLHWADSLSRDLLRAIAPAVGDVPVLLVLALRPPDDERPLDLPHLRELDLSELEPAEARALAEMLLAHVTAETADPATVEAVVARADGNPFYLEELVREIRDCGGRTDDLPTSLESLILGRLDRLSAPQQLTAKVASVIGRRVASDWLIGAYVGTLDGTRVPRDLIDLSATGLIMADAPPPEGIYLFRHVIVRDVAYETLSYRLRQSLHEQLARYLEQVAGEDPPVDLLAYHYARSANTAKEGHYRRLAAELAIRNGAYPEALAHVQRASEIVAQQPAGAERTEQELELALLLGAILLVTDGQGSAKAKAVYDRARALCRELAPGPTMGRAVFGLWTYYLFQGEMGPTAELADEAVALGEASGDPGVQIMAHLAESQTHMWTGRWHKCVEHFDEVMALYDPAQHQAYLTHYAQNPRFTASNSAFWGEAMRGNVEQAHRIAEEAIAEAKALQHAFTCTIAFLGRPFVAWVRRHDDELQASVGEYVEWARRAGNPFYIALSLAFEAVARVRRGEVEAGVTQLERQLEAMHGLGSHLCDPLIVSFLADGYLHAGRHGDGLALLERTMPEFEQGGRVSFLPEHLRLQAKLLHALAPGDSDEALALLERARGVAREHNSRLFELRAALAAARMLREGDERARELLEPMLAGFTEGLDDPDLREAREVVER